MLNQINYAESSVVATVYTELFGLQSYIINGVRSKKAKIKSNILQPLSMLDMGVYNRDKRSLQRIKYANAVNPTSQIGMDIVKGSLAMFIAEVLYRSIREEEPNQDLFNFLSNLISSLEKEEGSVANYHLLFMLDLSNFLGFYPSVSNSVDACYFDKREGVFYKEVPPHGDWLDSETSSLLKLLMGTKLNDVKNLKLSSAQRNDLISHLIAYYNLHLDTRIEIKSHKILQTVMQ
ncbi:MAG: DNA repair protein RecO [Flavobacteriales bacterium]|nr:DNA repair protein RecO [Flavobacteriales bacterium]